MTAMASQITGVSIVCSAVCWGSDQIKPQSPASLAFVRGIHRSPVDSHHNRPVRRKWFPFDDVIMFMFVTQIQHNTLSVLFGSTKVHIVKWQSTKTMWDLCKRYRARLVYQAKPGSNCGYFMWQPDYVWYTVHDIHSANKTGSDSNATGKQIRLMYSKYHEISTWFVWFGFGVVSLWYFHVLRLPISFRIDSVTMMAQMPVK